MTILTEAELSQAEYENIAARIEHVLTVYPVLSPTLLQGALGPQVSAAQWRPVLDDMITSGKVKQESKTLLSPAGRHNDYTRLMLATTNI